MNYALSFDGVNDYVNVGSSTSLDVDAEGTLAMWIKSDNLPSDNLYHRILRIPWSNGSSWLFSKGYSDADNPNTLYWYEIGTDNNLQANSSVLTANIWHYIVYTWKVGVTTKLYVDNAYITQSWTTLASVSRTPSSVAIAERWDGVVDDVRIYNRALSTSEVLASYQGQAVDRTGLVGEWLMTEGSGTTIADTSGQANTGTFGAGSAAPTWTTVAPWVQGVQSVQGIQTITL